MKLDTNDLLLRAHDAMGEWFFIWIFTACVLIVVVMVAIPLVCLWHLSQRQAKPDDQSDPPGLN